MSYLNFVFQDIEFLPFICAKPVKPGFILCLFSRKQNISLGILLIMVVSIKLISPLRILIKVGISSIEVSLNQLPNLVNLNLSFNNSPYSSFLFDIL